jgi:hypothetical protein
MTTQTTPPPIERASVEQARELLAAAHDSTDLAFMSGRIRSGQTSLTEDRIIRAIQQAHAAGVAEGLEQAAKVAIVTSEKRQRIYIDKREASDPAAPDDCNRWDRMADHAEAARLTGLETATAIRKISPGETA